MKRRLSRTAFAALLPLSFAACSPAEKAPDTARTFNEASTPVAPDAEDALIKTWACSTDLSDGPLTFVITSETSYSAEGVLRVSYQVLQSEPEGKIDGRLSATGVWKHEGDTLTETVDNIQIDDLFIDDTRAVASVHHTFLDRYTKMLVGTRTYDIKSLDPHWLSMTSDRGTTKCA